MSPARIAFGVCCLLTDFAVTRVHAATTIVVNCGRHASAEAAGRSEEQVNWLDGDVADDIACTHSFAALEMQHYLRKMTGRAEDFAVVSDGQSPDGDLLLVGGPEHNAITRQFATDIGITSAELARLGPEGYLIRTRSIGGRNVTLIAGGDRVGTLYGAYDFLYRLGCRWFAPGELHEEVPAANRIDVPDVTSRPSFLTRGFLAWENRGNSDFLLWMARNRMNYWCIEEKQHASMHKLGIRMVCGLHDAEELFLNPSNPYPHNHPRWQGDESKPADPYSISPQFQGDADHDGKLSLFEAHPEWYALVDGQRIPGIRGWFGTNYCTSNAEATSEFMKHYLQALIDGPYRNADIVRFWTLDGGKWCPCAACQALGTPTDRNLLLVARLNQEIQAARAAGKIHRPMLITFLAYHDVLEPPTRPLSPGLSYDTCAATFYPIGRCYVHNFDDPKCENNSRYLRQLEGWATAPQRHYQGQIAIGEYYNVSQYKCLPICFMHTMANDIPYYYRIGARHFDYMHVTTGQWGNKALTNYQMARQLWDVTIDCPALWDDYFARRYGAAAKMMRQFYESLERMLSNVTPLKYNLARNLERGAADLFPSSHLRWHREPGLPCDGSTLEEIVAAGKDCRKFIDEALRMPLPQRIRARIVEDEQMFVYGERTVQYYEACVQAYQLGRTGRRQQSRPFYEEARRLADLLRNDTQSATLSSSHANSPNALGASNAAGALQRLAELLGEHRERTGNAKSAEPKP